MHVFFIKEDGPDLDLVITRSLLALAAIAAFLLRNEPHIYLNYTICALLIIAAFCVQLLTRKWRIPKMLLLLAAATALYIATRALVFTLLLVIYALAIRYLNKEPFLTVGAGGVTVKKMFSTKIYPWSSFSNVILKDGMLTLDFKTNTILQLDIDESRTVISEAEFNGFCRANLEFA